MKNIGDYEEAGLIASKVLMYGKSLIKKNASLLEVTEKIEGKIRELGAKPAFPVQISMNDVAAHYCAAPDENTFFDNQKVCLDVGVHINGCIGDNACTIDLSNENKDLILAAEKALENSIRIIQIGTNLGEIGKAIEETITSYGFQPVRNLSGHGLDLYNIHASPIIPNYNTKDKTCLEKGQIIAIEPFATNGIGLVNEEGLPNVFSIDRPKPVRIGFVRQIMDKIMEYKGLPFTKRWLIGEFSLPKINIALKQFKQLGILKEYPPLVERSNGLVSQAEHTVLVDEKARILTKSDSEFSE